MPDPEDRTDRLVEAWRAERPDLDLETMALVARLIAVARLLGAGIDRLAADYGLDRAQGDVLFTLRRAGAPYRLSPKALSAALLVSSGTLTNRLERLEERGLITRRANPKDRRGLDAQLTRKALRLIDGAVDRHVENEQRMLEPLSLTEREQLDRTTRKLLAHLAG